MYMNKVGFFSPQKCARRLIAVPEGALGCTEYGDLHEDVIKYCSQGQVLKALILIHKVVREGICHSFKLYLCLLKACIDANFLHEGKRVHDLIVESGYDMNIFLENTLIDMYSKCGSLCDASHIFNSMHRHNVFSYTAMISAFTANGENEKAVEVFHLMQIAGLMPDKFVFTLVLKSCASLGALAYGRHAHSFFIISGLESDGFVISALIDLYAKCGIVSDSRQVFDDAIEKDIHMWTSMIASYAQQGNKEVVLQLFNQMQLEGAYPNNITCLAFLKVCSSPAALEDGKRLHTFILGNELENNMALSNTLVDMYAKSRVIDARHLFDKMVNRDVVSWNIMITAYIDAGQPDKGIMLFEEMQQKRVTPNHLTFVAVLKGCIQLENVLMGMLMHACIVEILLDLDNFIQSNLLNMYAKCGSMKDAQRVFNDIDKASVVSWTALIAGYTREGKGRDALALYERMKHECIEPDELAIVSVLRACGSLGALQRGKRIHEDIMKTGLHCQLTVRNALIEMYAKCGSLKDASEVLGSQQGMRDVVSWNTIISGYAQQGLGKQALEHFKKMLEEGQKPDGSTFLAVLTACRHAGQVKQGRQHLDSMNQDYGILPTMDHYACLVDLLCYSGRVDEAEAFILKMEAEPDARVWMSLLGGCRCRGHVETAERAYKHILRLNPTLPGAYVILNSIFAKAGMWKDEAKIRKEMDLLGIQKKAEHTLIEVEDEIHMFSGCNGSHPRMKDIEAELKRLSLAIKKVGYRPTVSKVLEKTAYKKGEDVFCEHSEKFAVAYGLISTSPGTPVRITKDLRVCGDCHAALEKISEVEGREIFARDASCFHHFKYGVCSCGDFW